MGLFDFVSDAGKKLFGGGSIDENAVREHLLTLGLKVRALSVIAHQDKKMVSLVGKVDSLEDKEKLIVAAGNISGVEKVDDRLKLVAAGSGTQAPEVSVNLPPAEDIDDPTEPSAEESPNSQFYTVQSGDTLGAIAKRVYGDAGKYPVIFEANRPMLTDPDKIYPGQVLRIPNQ